MVKKILVATDGSAVAGKAVAYAADLAKQLSASLRLIGVVNRQYLLAPRISPDVSPTEIAESTEDILRQATTAYLDEAAEECRKRQVDASTVVRIGHPVEEIVREAESGQVDLIVLGSHGRSALQAALLGSVAYGVLHKEIHIPVLIVRR